MKVSRREAAEMREELKQMSAELKESNRIYFEEMSEFLKLNKRKN